MRSRDRSSDVCSSDLAGQGQDPARQAAVEAGIPYERTAYQINQLCGSGLRAVAIGSQAVRVGDSRIVVCGGQESMGTAPHAAPLRTGQKLGDPSIVDSMLKDGLGVPSNGHTRDNPPDNAPNQSQIP